MARRRGVTKDMVVDAATAVLDDTGSVDAVTLGAVAARLGLRTQSLYAHVDGLDGLRRELALRSLDSLADDLVTSAVGRAGPDAITGIIGAYVDFARRFPGRYDASLRAPGDDPDLQAAVARVTAPLDRVLRGYGLDNATVTNWYRLIYAAVHGFTDLHRKGLYTMPGDPEDTVQHMIAVFASQVGKDQEYGPGLVRRGAAGGAGRDT